MTFKDLDVGNIFYFDGAFYMKFEGSNGYECFMVSGFSINNKPENVKDDTEVNKVAENLKQYVDMQP